MLVSVIISAFNEEKYLPRLFKSIKKQTYTLKKIEIVLINAMSTDKTRFLMEDFALENQNVFYDIKVLDNPKKNQPSGFNMGIKNSVGDVILKIDAHSDITYKFVEENIKVICSGEFICGGMRPTIVENNDSFSKILHLVEENMFGSSISNYRSSKKSKYVNSVFHGMYRRDVFKEVGLANEQLVRTEDNEFHYRVRKKGYKIRYDSRIVSYQYIRPTLKKMIKQKYSNGYWIGLTSHVNIKCFSIFHFVPFLFVLGLIISGFISIFWTNIFQILLLSVYASLLLLVSVVTIIKNKFTLTNLLLPILIFCVHISYGLGTIVGLVKGFAWKKTYLENYSIEFLGGS